MVGSVFGSITALARAQFFLGLNYANFFSYHG
jgi:hypothetical protein